MFGASNLVPILNPNVVLWVGRMNASALVSPPTTNGWIPWTLPTRSGFAIRFLAVGGGAGGGGGATGALGTDRCGGAGGGRGAFSLITIPLILLPRMIYIFAGMGGLGGAVGVNGSSATSSVVCCQSPGNSFNVPGRTILQSGNVATNQGAVGGGAGTTIAGPASACEAIATNTRQAYGGGGVWSAYGNSGLGSAPGGAPGAAGVNTNAWGANFTTQTIPVQEGAGGGSLSVADTPQAGGAALGGGKVPTTIAGAASGDGNHGITLWNPFRSSGGSGGGSSLSTGGRGGNGGWGSGGGGGGAGTTLGGAGGDGGPGFVMAWIL